VPDVNICLQKENIGVFIRKTNEEVSPSTDPDATCEVFAAVQRCAFIIFCICDVWDVMKGLYIISGSPMEVPFLCMWLLHLVANADRSSDKQRGAHAL